MEITVNGKAYDLPRSVTVQELLERLELAGRDGGVAVALNGDLVRRQDWERTRVQARDELEIVHATQGG